MTDGLIDVVEFDELVALSLAHLAPAEAPPPEVKQRLLARIAEVALAVPAGF